MSKEFFKDFMGLKYLPYHDMRGECDSQTKNYVEKICKQFGYTIEPGKPSMEEVDVIANSSGKRLLIDVERSKFFNNGVYHNGFGVVTIPARKTEFLEHRGAFWMCVDNQLSHYIIIDGTFVMLNGDRRQYYTRLNNQQPEWFFAIGMDKVQIHKL